MFFYLRRNPPPTPPGCIEKHVFRKQKHFRIYNTLVSVLNKKTLFYTCLGLGLGLGGVFSLKSMLFCCFLLVVFLLFCCFVLPIGSWPINRLLLAPLKEEHECGSRLAGLNNHALKSRKTMQLKIIIWWYYIIILYYFISLYFFIMYYFHDLTLSGKSRSLSKRRGPLLESETVPRQVF